jgi:lipid II:glycine glycyltransferase (peptidoglycan interpeptide bridge formation enzyme)
MAATARRDRFAVHTPAYYEAAYELLVERAGTAALLLAEHEGRPLAALFATALGPLATYLYGASADEGRQLMPTYLLQWEAMRWARARGCRDYDLLGVPDEDEATLEARFEQRSDGLWGVYRFKRGFGGRLWRTVGAWDRVYNPVVDAMYRLYLRWTRRGGADGM